VAGAAGSDKLNVSRPSNPSPAGIELRIPSDPARLADVRKAIESFVKSSGLDEAAAGELGLCVNEALANVMRHAYAGRTDQPIVVSAGLRGADVCVTIRDWGNGVDPSTLPRPAYDPLTPGGVGLICLQKLMDGVVYTPQPDGMLTTLVKKK
jgi:serine/threonine-protein kinase RsbW